MSGMTIDFRRTVPVFRIFDVAKAHEFYVDYLGCTVDWEHRFAPDMPLYTQVSRGDLVLHLSEHHGDATPGSTIYTELSGVRALHAELAGRNYPYLRPGLEQDEIGTSLTLTDPFGNRLRFNEPGAAAQPSDGAPARACLSDHPGAATSGTAPRGVVASPEYAQYAAEAPPCDAPHQTPRPDPG